MATLKVFMPVCGELLFRLCCHVFSFLTCLRMNNCLTRACLDISPHVTKYPSFGFIYIYRPRSEASDGYVFTGIYLSKSIFPNASWDRTHGQGEVVLYREGRVRWTSPPPPPRTGPPPSQRGKVIELPPTPPSLIENLI